MDTATFAEKIKAKYPQYKGVDDATLVSKIVEKYPVYAQQVNDLPEGSAPMTRQEEFKAGTQETTADLKQIGTDTMAALDRTRGKIAENDTARDTGEQGAFRTGLQNVGQVLKFGSDTIGSAFKGVAKALLPQGAEDKVKEGIRAVAEPIVESSPVQAIMQKYEQIKQTNPALARDIDSALGLAEFAGNFVGLEGASVGAKAGGEVLETGVKAGLKQLDNGANSAINSTKNVLGDALESTGQKIQTSVIKPSTRDIKDGFKIENVSKYDLGGSLPETVAKAHTKINELTQSLNSKLAGSDASINLQEAFDDTTKALLGDKMRSFGDNSSIQRVLENLKSEINDVAGKEGVVGLVDATNVKRGAGTKGAWAFNRPEADAGAIEKVYTEFYSKLKGRIEQAAPEGVREINKQISDLIPISNAALRRMTIEERNNILNLTESIGLLGAILDPKALAIYGLSKASRSGKVGEALSSLGKKIKQ